MKSLIDSAILFALVSTKSCQALALALEPDQAGLDRRDYDTIQYRHFWRKSITVLTVSFVTNNHRC
jgi:hypothetical protein